MAKKGQKYKTAGKMPRGRGVRRPRFYWPDHMPLNSRQITLLVPEETHQRVYEAVKYVQTNDHPTYCAADLLIEAVEWYTAFLEERGVLMEGWRPTRSGDPAQKGTAFEHKLFYMPDFSSYTHVQGGEEVANPKPKGGKLCPNCGMKNCKCGKR